jgi:hypothetical protein
MMSQASGVLNKIARVLLQVFGSVAIAFGCSFLISALYASATTPQGQLNESVIGYLLGAFLLIAGAGVFAGIKVFRQK